MPVYKQYRFDSRGWLEAIEETFSDLEIDVSLFMPPAGCTFTEPPVYDPALQIPVWDGGAWTVHELSEFEPTLAEVKTAKLAELAQARWEQETGGLTLPDGTEIRTDRESQALLTGAAFSATLDTETLIEWKGATGWVVLTPQQILQIAGLVRQHVQGAFSKEKALSERVRVCSTAEELGKITW